MKMAGVVFMIPGKGKEKRAARGLCRCEALLGLGSGIHNPKIEASDPKEPRSASRHVEHEHRLFPGHGMKLKKKNKFKGIEKEQGET